MEFKGEKAKAFGQRLHQVRTRQGRSPEQMAQKLGITQAGIARIELAAETGKLDISRQELDIIENNLNVNARDRVDSSQLLDRIVETLAQTLSQTSSFYCPLGKEDCFGKDNTCRRRFSCYDMKN